MYKKLLAFLLVVAMLASLCACGKAPVAEDNPAVSPEATDNASAAENAEEELPYVELDWLTYDMGDDYMMVYEALGEYVLEKLNLKLNFIDVQDADYPTTLNTMLQAGEELGLAHMHTGVSYVGMASQGMLYPVDEVWNEYGPVSKSLFSEDVWASLTVDGHVYGIPSLKDNAYVMGYSYNQTLADELGIDMGNDDINHVFDLEQILLDAKAKRDALHPEWADEPISNDIAVLLLPCIFEVESFLGLGSPFAVCNVPGMEEVPAYDCTTVYNLFETEEYKEFCLMQQRLVEAGVLAYEYTPELKAELYKNPAVLYLEAGWGRLYQDEHRYSQEFSAGVHYYDERVFVDASNLNTTGYIIPANCPDPERAMMFIDLMNSDPYCATLLRFGIEGVHYTYDENGRITKEGSERNSDPENLGFWHWKNGPYGNITIIENAPADLVGPNDEFFTTLLDFNNNAKTTANMGLVIDSSNFTNELAACNNVVAEYETTLRYGRYESPEDVLEAIDAFNAKLKANGVEKIIADIQAQVDAFQAQK